MPPRESSHSPFLWVEIGACRCSAAGAVTRALPVGVRHRLADRRSCTLSSACGNGCQHGPDLWRQFWKRNVSPPSFPPAPPQVDASAVSRVETLSQSKVFKPLLYILFDRSIYTNESTSRRSLCDKLLFGMIHVPAFILFCFGCNRIFFLDLKNTYFFTQVCPKNSYFPYLALHGLTIKRRVLKVMI